MNPPSVEFMMIAARGIALALALITLAWVIVRWRRDITRDAQRVFEQLDLVRAELLQLQGQMGTDSVSLRSAAPQQRNQAPLRATNSQSRPVATKQPAYPDFETERQAIASTRRPPDVIKSKSLTNAAPRGYEVAARLARNGAAVDELMNTCALSRHEAELLVRLHAGMKSIQPPAGVQVKNDKPVNAVNAGSRANANLNQLKNIGDRNKAVAKPAASLTNRSASSLRPAAQQRVSLVG